MFDVIIDLYEWVTGKGSLNFLSELINGLFGSLIQGPADKIVLQSNLIYNVYTLLIPVAMMIMLVGFGMALTEMAMDQQISPENIVKKFLFLIMAMMLLNSGVKNGVDNTATASYENIGWLEKLYTYTTDISKELVDKTFVTMTQDQFLADIGGFVNDLGNSDDVTLVDIITNPVEALWSILISVVMWVIYALFSILVSLFVFGVGVIRAVKLGIYLSMTPIAVACYYNKTPMGMGYLKTLAALFIQQWVIILAGKMVFAMSGTVKDPLSAFIMMFTLIGTVLSSESKAKELLR